MSASAVKTSECSISMRDVVSEPMTKQCATIDPVLDYDEKSGVTYD